MVNKLEKAKKKYNFGAESASRKDMLDKTEIEKLYIIIH
jgi:hypothetical protein